MKKIITGILLMLLLVGCSPSETEAPTSDDGVDEVTATESAVYRNITPEEAKEMMTEDVVVLDVRTESEYNEGHIENAVLLPVTQIQEGDFSLLPDKDQVILVYCRSGNRSQVASNALVEAGYTQVFDFGGINKWPYEVVVD